VSLLPVIFEDESSTGFRPLAWSVPVGELRCGILNCRERLALLAGREPALLVRGFLCGLAAACGHQAGPVAIQALLGRQTRLLLVSGRLGANWDLLAEAVRIAAGGADLAWRDEEGWLAIAVSAEEGAALLASWQQWDAAAAAAGCWLRADRDPPRWQPATVDGAQVKPGAWRRIWDLGPATAGAIAADLARLDGRLPARRVWGAVPVSGPEPAWSRPVELRDGGGLLSAGVVVRDAGNVRLGEGCDVAAGVAIDASAGPVVLGRDVRVLPHAYLEGPLFVGSGSLIKAGASIYGETSLGAVNRIGGEVGETTCLDFVNKQHEGFLGHAYLGSWSNLGALTTCSDLKNTYGTVRVDLGRGAEDSGLRFVGLLMGEHAKTAIGTLFNTGTSVGFASNVFGAGFPAKYLPCFTWGAGDGGRQDPERALATARIVMDRRGCRLTDGHAAVFRSLAA